MKTMLFKVDLVDAQLFVEAEDWEAALKKATQVAPKIFKRPALTMMCVVGSYSKYHGVWV